MKVKLGIREKFMIFVIIILFLLSFILTGISIVQQRNIVGKLEKELKARGYLLSQSIARESVVDVFLEDKKALAGRLKSLKDVDYAFILDSQGNVLAKIGKRESPFYKKFNGVKEPFSYCYRLKGERFCEFISPVFAKKEEQTGVLGVGEKSSTREGVNIIGMVVIGISLATIDAQLNILVTRSLILMLVVVPIGIYLTFTIFTRLIISPLYDLVRVAKYTAEEGDLTKRVEKMYSDEMGVAIGAFNSMISSLHEIVSEVRASSDKVTNLAETLYKSAQEVNASTQEVSSAINDIAQITTTQVKLAGETSQIVDKMFDSVKKVANNASEGTKESIETRRLAEKGVAESIKAVDKTKNIIKVSEEIADMVGELGRRSEEIGRIVEMITSIADQTNLLALNAAIEAARAGEAGRGFAVVAEEVRKLADNSAQAAEQIGEVIKNIQEETAKAVNSVTKATKEVEEGALLIDNVRKSLEIIMQAIEKIAARVTQIAISAETQFNDAKEVEKRMKEVTTVTENAASSTEEVLSLAEETSATMEELTSISQKLADMATHLKTVVGRFKL